MKPHKTLETQILMVLYILEGYEISQDCILESSQKSQQLFAKSKEWHYLHSINYMKISYIESNVWSTIVFRY